MNVALIFAGGSGIRMNSKSKPKQFLELYGKEIIVYTVEIFQNHPSIDKILVVCLETWIDHMKYLVKKYALDKVVEIVPGGRNTQESQYFGLQAISNWEDVDDNTIVLIHDGVRPLLDEDTITRNIESVEYFGSAITVTDATETIMYLGEEQYSAEVIDRKRCRMAKAPQSYYLKDIYSAHLQSIKEENYDFIDSACMMQYYGHKLHMVEGNIENIKITTPTDFYLFRAIKDAKENSQIWGL